MRDNDLRVIKTKRALASAFLSLLDRQKFTSITVNDVCTEALVGRSTFYTHFNDKYDLLHFSMSTIRQRLFAEGSSLPMEERIKDVLLHIQENLDLFKNLISANLDPELVEMMRSAFHDDMIRLIEAEGYDSTLEPKGPPELISIFYASGITSTIMLWIGKGMPYTIDEMAACLNELLPHFDKIGTC